MSILAAIIGVVLIALILLEAFETIILPRRVNRRLRLTRLFYLSAWRIWIAAAHLLPGGVDREGEGRRKQFLGLFAPLSVLVLLALWATGLVLGFALLVWGVGGEVAGVRGRDDFASILYMSGITFFTVGFGDVTPRGGLGRFLSVAEGATGFSFLAVIIGYLPLIFTRLAQREISIVLLDARAGSPPTAAAFLSRLGPDDGAQLAQYLREWEQWAAELLESHLSYPMLAFFRSQHEHQSWLAALTVMLDAAALVIVGVGSEVETVAQRQARLTFAMARHAAGDLCQALQSPPEFSEIGRLPPAELMQLRQRLAMAGIPLRAGPEADQQLTALRQLYEPYVTALAHLVRVKLPLWLPEDNAADDWETTAWQWDPTVARSAISASESPVKLQRD